VLTELKQPVVDVVVSNARKVAEANCEKVKEDYICIRRKASRSTGIPEASLLAAGAS
jgi:hypothetical protein